MSQLPVQNVVLKKSIQSSNTKNVTIFFDRKLPERKIKVQNIHCFLKILSFDSLCL